MASDLCAVCCFAALWSVFLGGLLTLLAGSVITGDERWPRRKRSVFMATSLTLALAIFVHICHRNL